MCRRYCAYQLVVLEMVKLEPKVETYFELNNHPHWANTIKHFVIVICECEKFLVRQTFGTLANFDQLNQRSCQFINLY